MKNSARADEIMRLAVKHGAVAAAQILAITHQAVYASLKRWYPSSILPKPVRPKKHETSTAEAKAKRKEQVRQAGRRRYAKAKEAGNCLKCLAAPADKGYETCEACREKLKAYYHARKKTKKA